MASKKVKVGVGVAVGVTTVGGLFYLLTVLYGFQITNISGDIVCEGTVSNPCVSEFSVYNPKTYDVILEGNSSVDLEFDKKIKDYELWVDEGKGYRKLNFTNNESIKFTKKKEIKFKLIGHKNSPNDVIKWTFNSGSATLDPYWNGMYVNKIEVVYG